MADQAVESDEEYKARIQSKYNYEPNHNLRTVNLERDPICLDQDFEENKYPVRQLKKDFLDGMIMAGATTVSKMQGVVYLAQFGDLNGEFAQNPIFEPSFVIGAYPLSQELFNWLNTGNEDFGYVAWTEDGNTFKRTKKDIKSVPSSLDSNNQVSRLYQICAEVMEDFKLDGALFDNVAHCYMRNCKIFETHATLR
ncbi:hypothetical protein HOD05_00670 [Candidatus Woesearchaeota archaeon]|jgi:hypothetical protein|nr:hypothetical protein [Candidatus Woesearchaeota archaeon]MBT4150919.1 hypothetical protein [Candidatus Woesearchaeota archaeon]MBT4247106.1 hypothetical protein [Candidatus Woesearchaeota archaeon]MBT4433709.1 hypothetical protein [Candidatus Woesearchaeota archaeon]MBT7332460.1 hypothetical protein [Candidatus Woesearchaeota archaeon]